MLGSIAGRTAIALAALALVGCGGAGHSRTADEQDDSTARSAAAPAPAATANSVTITARDFAFDAPDSIPAGLTTVRFVNRGTQLHHATFVKLGDGHTMRDLMAAMQQPGPLPSWAELAGGPNAVVPGDSSNITQVLEPGSYVVLCVIPGPDGVPHMAKGMERAFTVVPSAAAAAAEPTADVTVTLADYTFTLSTPLTAGRHVIRVDNSGPQPHELVLARLGPGKTALELAQWAEKQQGPPPGMPFAGLSPMHVGGHAYFTVDLTPGTYALICFLPDAKDGKPHFEHGMVKQFTVS